MSVFVNQVGLCISEDRLQLVEIINNENKLFLENVDEEFFEESIDYKTKESKFIHILQNSFNEIVLRKPLQSSTVSFTLPHSFFKIFELPVDKNLTKNDLNEYISWELNKLFPYEKRNFYTYRKIVSDSAAFLSYRRIIVFAIPINILQRLHKFSMRNNLKLKLVDHPHTSLYGFILKHLNSEVKLSLFIENMRISVLLFSGNNIVFESHTAFENINEVASNINSIKDEIFNRDLITDKIDETFLFGNAVTKELKNSIQKSIDSEIKNIDPFNDLDINHDLEGNNFINEHASRFAQSTALILRI